MSEYKPVKGDRVRVVLEGENRSDSDACILLEDDPRSDKSWRSTYVKLDADFLVSIEKIEPPVEVFGPGDRLRRKVASATPFEITLAGDGYLHHFSVGGVEFFPYADGQADDFNSDRYELVYRA